MLNNLDRRGWGREYRYFTVQQTKFYIKNIFDFYYDFLPPTAAEVLSQVCSHLAAYSTEK
jgi:hypothetical protein